MDASTVEVYEEDTGDQPVDYSIKYSERNALTQSRLTDNSQTDRSSKKEFVDHEAKVDLFGDYAETDLDQPTDYSLRYAEDDTDDDEKQSPEYFPSSMQEDTIKTYCTEDTPYETPFNFSTATSMSDLRVVDTKDGDILKKAPKKVIEVEQKTAISFKQRTSLRCEDGQKDLENQKNSPMLEHGQVTPEKIVGYYDGGTSDGFSRANSLSSLSSAVTQQKNASDINSKGSVSDNKEKTNIESIVHNSVGLNRVGLRLAMESGSSTEGKNNPRVVDKEGKVVTFGGQDYYAEETPLMFSRCSSLGSLSGFEQHSIHDDRSSIVSDFSRRTSGIVSPSELPDSPTQTVPPSPHNHKTQASEFGNKIQEDGVRSSVQHLLCSKSHISRNSVFEDDIATFKEESTPIEFSTATSLSSLTIDDEPRIFDNSKSETKLQHALSSVEKDIEICEYAKISLVEIEKDQDQVSDGDDDDEDMLAACISRGIANNRYRQSFKISNIHKPVQSESSNILTKYPKTAILNRLESSVSPIATETSLIVSKSNKTPMEIGVVPDTVYVYCTEDTPADISPVGSQSNLSALSMPSVQEDVEKPEVECQRNDLSDESSNLSGEDEKILHECIQSGIPKVRQITPPPQNSIHFAKKPEILPQKFNICGTPSSSPVEIVHINKNPILQKPMLQATRTHESGLSDESPNQSDDEAILTECIQSAMPKVRSNMPLLVRSVLPIIEKTDITNNRSSLPSMSFYPTEYPVRAKATLKKPQPFEDNLSLSEEEDIILAQCIRSGMPKMHPRAFFVLVLVLALGRGIRCEDKTGWYSGLRTVFKNCPSESWNASAQDEFLEMFRRCLQTRALTALDTFLEDDVIPVFDGLDLVRFQEDRINSSASERNGKLEESDNWTTIILNRLIRILRTHVFKVDVDYLTSAIKSQLNGFGTDLNNNVVEGRRRRHKRRHHHMMPLMMMGLLLMGSILVPMGFQFLAVLGGKALILAKMALILSSIQGLKKIATNGVNYGLYHTPVAEGWHERSNQETPPHFDLPYPTYPRSHL